MIVADTCLVTHLFNETFLTEIAQEILKKDNAWILPPLWQEEYANVLSKLARKEQRAMEEVIGHYHYTVGEIQNGEIPVENAKALQLSIEFKISVYDAHFIALAIDFQTIVVTEDKELIKKCPELALSMSGFLKT